MCYANNCASNQTSHFDKISICFASYNTYVYIYLQMLGLVSTKLCEINSKKSFAKSEVNVRKSIKQTLCAK